MVSAAVGRQNVKADSHDRRRANPQLGKLLADGNDVLSPGGDGVGHFDAVDSGLEEGHEDLRPSTSNIVHKRIQVLEAVRRSVATSKTTTREHVLVSIVRCRVNAKLLHDKRITRGEFGIGIVSEAVVPRQLGDFGRDELGDICLVGPGIQIRDHTALGIACIGQRSAEGKT